MLSTRSPHKGCLMLLCVVLPLLLRGQNKDPLERAQAYIQKAEDYYARAQYEASIKEYQFASQIYRQEQRADLYGICYNGVGNNYINLTRYAEAFTEFSRVLHQYKEMSKAVQNFAADSTIIADAYEGLGRFFMNAQENLINTRLEQQKAINFDTALHYHKQALGLRSRFLGEDHPKVALSYYYMAQCYGGMSIDTLRLNKDPNYKNPLEQQLLYLEKALELQIKALGENHYQTADTYDALGDYQYEVLRNFQKGMEYHQKSLNIRLSIFGESHPKIAESYIGIATHYRALNLYETELEYLEKALQLRRNIFGDTHKDIAKNYFLLANRYRSSGDLEKALTYYQQAQSIFRQLQGELSVEVADVFLQLALCQRDMGDQRAQERVYLEKCLDLRQRIYGNQHFKVAEVYFELGNYFIKYPTCFSNLQLRDSLTYFYNLADQIWTRQLGKEHRYRSQLWSNYARYSYLTGDESAEIDFLKRALQAQQSQDGAVKSTSRFDMMDSDGLAESMAETAQSLSGHDLFERFLNLCKFYRRKNDYATAIAYAQNALAAVTPGLSGADSYKNPGVRDLSKNLEWIEALQQKADLFRLQYIEGGKKNAKDIDFALECYKLSLALLDTLRLKFNSDASRKYLTVRSIPVYEGAIMTYFLLYETDKKSEYMDQAFRITEHSKAFVLLQSLNAIRARGIADVPGTVLIEEERLRRTIAHYENNLSRGGKEADYYQKQLFDKKRSYDSLLQVIQNQYPRYHAMRQKTEVCDLKLLREKLLNSETLLLEYFLGDEFLYIFVAGGQGHEAFKQIPLSRNYTALIHQLRRQLTDYDQLSQDPALAYTGFVKASLDFYQTFVQPALTDIPQNAYRKLVVVPDGALNYIPFEVLLRSQPESMDRPAYKSLDYLLRDFQINYAYSATLLIQNKNHDRLRNNGRCLGFAPTYDRADKEELPWAEKELKSIQGVFGGDYYYGSMASKDLFMSKAPNYAVVHLAMHGVADARRPMNSKLAFYAPEGKSEEGYLYAYEINNLRLNAELVVLSACQTGYGKALRGEGVVSLAWAFMYAGAPGLVTTLWEVNDYTSSAIMTNFYRHLDRGYSKSESLRQAKLQYLDQADHISGHPIFWSGFVAIGDDAPIARHWAWWQWVLLITGSIAALYLLYRRYRNRLLHKRTEFDTDMKSDADALLGLLHHHNKKTEENDTDESPLEIGTTDSATQNPEPLTPPEQAEV